MKLLSILLKLILGLVAIFVIVGLFLPSTVSVERSIRIERAADQVFPLLDGFQRFNEWSPWFDLDPDADYQYSGPPAGVGAAMRWSGNEQVRRGGQTILASEPLSRVEIELDFEGQKARSEYLLEALDGATLLRWRFHGDFGWDLTGRWFGLLMDRFIGADYERGLERLKRLAESQPEVVEPAPDPEPEDDAPSADDAESEEGSE